MDKPKNGPIQQWAKEIDWRKRVTSVCKPCWEIKYCPFGPLVEQFPLAEESDLQSCRIFGHICPVFFTAEPFTETKQLRNVSRTIPRATQFRVLKRENQICCVCGKAVKDEEIEFDHIIPWSKGGSSDEHNIRLLCRDCNRKKSNKFEDENLVGSYADHIKKPIEIDFIKFLLDLLGFSHEYSRENEELPQPPAYNEIFGESESDPIGDSLQRITNDFYAFFDSKRPREFKARPFKALKYRWGFIDGTIHKLRETATKNGLSIEEMVNAEIVLIERVGWKVSANDKFRERLSRI